MFQIRLTTRFGSSPSIKWPIGRPDANSPPHRYKFPPATSTKPRSFPLQPIFPKLCRNRVQICHGEVAPDELFRVLIPAPPAVIVSYDSSSSTKVARRLSVGAHRRRRRRCMATTSWFPSNHGRRSSSSPPRHSSSSRRPMLRPSPPFSPTRTWWMSTSLPMRNSLSIVRHRV